MQGIFSQNCGNSMMYQIAELLGDVELYARCEKGVVCGNKFCHCRLGSCFHCFAHCTQGRWDVVILYRAIQPVCHGCVRTLWRDGFARKTPCDVVQLEHIYDLFCATCATFGSKHASWGISRDVFGGGKLPKPPCLPRCDAFCLPVLFAKDRQFGCIRLDNCNFALLWHDNVPTKRIQSCAWTVLFL